MRLVSFKIKRFKSIIDTHECLIPDIDNILILAGQNEAGKSAVIEALNLFRNGPSPDFERIHKRQDDYPIIICKFILDSGDIDRIFDETKKEKLKSFLQRNPVVEFVRGKEGATDISCLNNICLSDVSIGEFKKYFNTNESGSEGAKNPGEPPGEVPDRILGLDDLEKSLVSELGQFIFYDTFKDLLPGVVTVSEVDQHPAVLDFQKVFKINFSEEVRKEERAISRTEQRVNQEASDDLNTYWKQRIEEGGRYNFSIKINTQPPVEAASKLEFKIDRNDGDPLFMEQKSKGFCWFSAFNLRLKSLGIKESTIRKLVILIDEPGQGLHEKAQRDVKEVLEELATKGAQIIYTTHCPSLIGVEGKEFARIRLVSNTKTDGTRVDTVSQFASKSHVGSYDTLSPIITAMGMNSVGPLVDSQRCNVVVEGISDHYYFEAFKKLLNKNQRLYFLPACGVNNITNLASILIGWGFNFRAVLDEDQQSGRRAYNLLKNEFYERNDELAHKFILKIKDCNGIEDVFASKDFYQFVLNEPLPKIKNRGINSKLAEGRKEILARLFLEKVEKEKISLSKESLDKINEIFAWLYKEFNFVNDIFNN